MGIGEGAVIRSVRVAQIPLRDWERLHWDLRTEPCGAGVSSAELPSRRSRWSRFGWFPERRPCSANPRAHPAISMLKDKLHNPPGIPARRVVSVRPFFHRARTD
jgi:hypothetical protein